MNKFKYHGIFVDGEITSANDDEISKFWDMLFILLKLIIV